MEWTDQEQVQKEMNWCVGVCVCMCTYVYVGVCSCVCMYAHVLYMHIFTCMRVHAYACAVSNPLTANVCLYSTVCYVLSHVCMYSVYSVCMCLLSFIHL